MSKLLLSSVNLQWLTIREQSVLNTQPEPEIMELLGKCIFMHARPHHTGHADTRKGVAMWEFFEIAEFIYIYYRIINVICNVSVWLFLIWTIKVLLNKNTSFKNKIMKIHFGKLCLILYSMNLECVEEIKKYFAFFHGFSGVTKLF